MHLIGLQAALCLLFLPLLLSYFPLFLFFVVRDLLSGASRFQQAASLCISVSCLVPLSFYRRSPFLSRRNKLCPSPSPPPLPHPMPLHTLCQSGRAVETLLACSAEVIPCDSSAHVVMSWAYLSLILQFWNNPAPVQLWAAYMAAGHGPVRLCQQCLLFTFIAHYVGVFWHSSGGARLQTYSYGAENKASITQRYRLFMKFL